MNIYSTKEQHPKSFRWMSIILSGLILVAALMLRTYNINWDEGTHLHPDERYLTMVAAAVKTPDTLAEYWDPARSSLNPANTGYAGYVYGTLPLFMTRQMGEWLDRSCGPDPAPLASMVRLLLLGTRSVCDTNVYTSYSGIHLVGRALSALADLLTLMGLMLIAARLYNTRAALLAGALYAFAVLPIQHAHFFVVDSFATVFVVGTLFFVTEAVVGRRPWLFILAGMTTGLAVASKASVWPLAGIVALGGIIQRTPEGEDGSDAHRPQYVFALSTSAVIAVALSGILAAIAFRTAQPYAFTGPGFLNVGINQRWMQTMQSNLELVRGLRDAPFGHQWTNRPPLVFPWKNMVFWGLGLPLGLCAWVGWAVMGWDMLRHNVRRHLWVWVWGTGFFLYQGTQWVKSMRYVLPIYPVFVLFAAWFLDAGLSYARGLSWFKIPQRWMHHGMRLLTLVVLLGTMLWAAAFLQIYVHPLTRVEASRWMFENIPTALNLRTIEGDMVPVPLNPNLILSPGMAFKVPVTFEREYDISHIVFPKTTGLGYTGSRTLRVKVLDSDTDPQTVLAETQTDVTPPADATAFVNVELAFASPVHLNAGQTVYLEIDLPGNGDPMIFQTSVIANEHWDDSLPQRVDGKDPFGTWYRGLSTTSDGKLALYNEDTYQKRDNLLRWLDEADYIVMSSNRLYASIPRLPMRYPMTVAYYDALFDGRLGFELLAEFVSFPALGPCQFPDQEAPFVIPEARYTNARPCSIPYPPAEEAFSVYDHPRVLIFAKTSAYSRETAEALLPVSLLKNVQQMTPREASKNKKELSLLMDGRLQAVQESGGTWSKIFHSQALHNRSQLVAIFLWWLMLTALGWMAFPWLTLAFPALENRGYGLARAAGLLLWAYPAWLLASLRLAPHTRPLLGGVFLAWSVATGWLVRSRWNTLREFLENHWRALLRIELLFAGLYLFWLLVRYLNPDLWHPVTGGEKPMDFAYLNAVIKSTWFPPYDPWFAGGIMNYYYFGFVLVGSLTEALGIVPSVAYNLIVPSLFAMTGTGAYTIASNLTPGDAKRKRLAGILGVLLVLLLGNLGEVRLLFNGFEEVGNIEFESLIPGYPAFISACVGFWKVLVGGQRLRFRPEWWYWDATRVIPFAPGDAGPINEFPLFTFIYADLHAHMMAFPLTQIALGVALQWGLSANVAVEAFQRARDHTVLHLKTLVSLLTPHPFITLVLGALAAGALRATNTWDYPTYLALMIVGFLFGLFQTLQKHKAQPARLVDDSILVIDALPVEEQVLNYGVLSADALAVDKEDDASGGQARTGETFSHASTDEPDLKPRRAWLVYLQLAVPVLLVILAELFFRSYTTNYAIAYSQFKPWPGMKTPLGIYLVMHGHFILPLLILGALQGERAFERLWGDDSSETLMSLGIVGAGMTVLIIALVFLMDVAVAWLAIPLGVIAALIVLDPESRPHARLLWFWVGTALMLSLVVEVVVLSGDIGRMNTVFKFYLQVWMLLALSAASAAARLLDYIFAPLPVVSSTPEVLPALSELPNPSGLPNPEPSTKSLNLFDNLLERDTPLSPDSDPDYKTFLSFPPVVGDLMLVAMSVLLFATALYTFLAIPAKVRDRWNPDAPHTLDGAEFLSYVTQYEHGGRIPLQVDYGVIRWFQENVKGTPTIIEIQAEREYLWGARVSIHTGLPSVAAWRWHQVQQRMVMPAGTVERRQFDVTDFYNTPNPTLALDILRRYGVDYVVLTIYERAYMNPEGLPKFTTLVEQGALSVAYEDTDAVVYRVE